MKKQLLIASLLLGSLLSANAQTTSFEFEEGFVVGPLGTQNGWTIAGATMPAANATIADDNSTEGINSLKVIGSNTQSSTLIGVYSPDYSIAATKVTVSQDIYPQALGQSDIYVDALDVEGTSLYLTSRVIFTYQGNITIATGVASGALTYANYGTFTAGTWLNLKVEYDFTLNTIAYYVNNQLIYTGIIYNGQQADRLAFRYDNYASGFSVDNVQIGETVLAVNENQVSNFDVYPNPVNDLINISNTQNVNVNKVTVTDLNGRVVKEAKYSNVSNAQLNVSDLSSGVYMLNIASDKGSSVKKIVKN